MVCRWFGRTGFALVVVGTAGWALAQDHQHAQAPKAQPSPLTPTAKKLNEGYQANCEQFAAGFESPGRELFDRRVDVANNVGLKPGMTVADIGAGSGCSASALHTA